MKKFHPVYAYVALFLALLFLFFTNDFGLINVRNTALITAVAIDKEDEEYVVTARMTVPRPSSQGKSAQPLLVSGKAKTVAAAFSDIAEKTGLFPKLVYCRALLLGGETIQENVFDALDYFLRLEYMADTCQIACTEEKAGGLLTADSSSSGADPLFPVEDDGAEPHRAGRSASLNLKDFAKDYYGETRCGYMPLLTPVKTDENQQESGSGGQSAEGGEGGESGGSEESGGGQGESEQSFESSSTALFVEGKAVGTLNADETFIFNLLRKKIELTDFEAETEDAVYALSLKNSKRKVKFKVEHNTPVYTAEVRVRASVSGIDRASGLSSITQSTVVPEEVVRAAEQKLEAACGDFFQKCVETGCDLLKLTDKLKRYENAYFHAYQKDILRLTKASFQVKILSSKKPKQGG